MRLILTTDVTPSRDLEESGRADIATPLMSRFIWGALPTDAELAAIFAPRTAESLGSHWLDVAFPLAKKKIGRDIGLIELCQYCKSVELWMETEPNGQLVLVWLLDYLHSHADATIGSKLILRHVDVDLGGALPTDLVKWRFRSVGITNDHLETGSLAWKAYRAPTPQAWFNLLEKDLSVLPQLRRCVLELLDELPGRATGPGASEMRLNLRSRSRCTNRAVASRATRKARCPSPRSARRY